MAFVKDFALELKKKGDLGFCCVRTAPVLVGLGISGNLMSQGGGPETLVASAAALNEVMAWSGRVFEIVPGPYSKQKSNVTLGRTTNTDITVNDFSISREHCAFMLDAGRVIIVDIGSRNGTQVGTARLRRGQSVVLSGGECITMGRLAFSFFTPRGFHAHVKEALKELR